MVTGDAQYRCFPDKPDCSRVDGCVRVCLPQVESCHSTVSPSSSWGTEHPTTQFDQTTTQQRTEDSTDQGYEIDNEVDNDTDNEIDNEIGEKWDNEVDSDASSGAVTWSQAGVTCSLIMHVVLVAMAI